MSERLFVKRLTDFSCEYQGPFVTKIHVFDDILSTNAAVHELARKGAGEGTVVIAQTQRKGRGRFDRVWQSPKGGVYLSLLLRPKAPPEKASLLGFVAALAVTYTIRSFNLPARIKWPNDVLVHVKKIAGILLESETDHTHVSYVIVGIGVNLNTDLALLPKDVRMNATSLHKEHGAPIEYEEFLTTFFHQFDRFYQLFIAGCFDQIIDLWKQDNDTLGKNVRVQTTNGVLQGTAVDIDEFGFLLLKIHEGKTVRVTSGDCTVIDAS
ncbi:MAG TPA: biotin--[acetyl-CoA-carboxylase] ligase [Candidatus Thermoplasmatota archaeon]|nr:biotin--[acetyl-CoA-carboxylase] ligase [Candidatus Thermoplasmatota archaeon]